MLHQGKIILDVEGEDKIKMNVPDLLELFRQHQGKDLEDDSALN